MSRNVLLGLVVIVLVVFAGWYFLKSQKSSVDTQTQTSQVTTETVSASPTASASGSVMETGTVKITSSGFTPESITIKAGESVTWTNDDSANHIVASNPHPTHTDYPPLNIGLIKPGDSKSLSFPTAGTYKYHDHLNPSLTGSVTVQ